MAKKAMSIILALLITIVFNIQAFANDNFRDQHSEAIIRISTFIGPEPPPTVRTFSVVFYLQGRGSAETVEYFEIPREVIYGETVEMPTIDPEYYEYYEFIEWVISSDSEEAFYFGTPITQDMRIYAQWEAIEEGDGSIQFPDPDDQTGQGVDDQTGQGADDQTGQGVDDQAGQGADNQAGQNADDLTTIPATSGVPSATLPQMGVALMNMSAIGVSLVLIAGVVSYLKKKSNIN